MDYNNPNDYWQGYDPYKGLSDDERMQAGCMQVTIFFLFAAILLGLLALFGSCTTTQYVPVPETHTEHHWHTDSVFRHDSTHTERQTTIMQLDSAQMAEYGIRLTSAERAWLVRTQEIERQLSLLMQQSARRDTVRDTVQVVCPVEVLPDKGPGLPWWQSVLMYLGAFVLGAVIVYAAAWFLMWRRK